MSYGLGSVKTWKGRQLGLMTEKTCKFLKKSRNKIRRIDGSSSIEDQMRGGEVKWVIMGQRAVMVDLEEHEENMKLGMLEAELEMSAELLRLDMSYMGCNDASCPCGACRSIDDLVGEADSIIDDWPDLSDEYDWSFDN